MPHPVLVAVAAGGFAYALLKSEKSHDQIVEEVYENLRYEAPSSASLYVDHVREDVPNPRTALEDHDLDHVPDVVCTSMVTSNLIVEVETEDTLDDDALSQLNEFRLQGYRRVLVVPNGDSETVSKFERRLNDEIPGKITVATPEKVPELL